VGALAVETPFGRLRLTSRDGALVSLDWTADGAAPADDPDAVLERAAAELAAYARDPQRPFTVPLAPPGTDYQRRVWEALRAIPAGETRTYGEVARAAGGVARAVGGACGANPIPILIPCHRVVAGAGLGGFSAAGGAALKRRLLAHERRDLFG
jgi:methylated-DNA-[protein]-cysteine S-methyltransferase